MPISFKFLSLFFAFLNFVFLIPIDANGQFNQVPDDIEFQALKDLFNNTNGSGWTNATNWLQGTSSADFATWYGVTVGNGDVQRITLVNNNLLGQLPESIGNLSGLGVLNFRNNRLVNIPESIGNVLYLYDFDISQNQVSSIPESIGNLYYLTQFSVHDNLIKSIPESIGNVPNLESLQISKNQITALPESIGNFSLLTIFFIAFNQIETLPESIGNLTNLSWFMCQNNQLNSLPENFKSLIGINLLTLENNKLPFTALEVLYSEMEISPSATITYDPQSTIPPQKVSLNLGSSLTLTSDDNSPNNHFQWQKNINGTWSDISGATAISYTIPSVTEDGQYRCETTNDWVTDLTLYSQVFELDVEESLVATPPADLIKNRPTDETGP